MKGYIETPALSSLSGNATLTFYAKTNSAQTLLVSISGGGSLSVSSVSVTTSWTQFSVDITGGTSTSKIKLSKNGSDKKYIYIDDIVIAPSDPVANISMTTTDVDLKVGDTYNERTASSSTTGATIAYSSSATGVATVNSSTGEVSAVSEGTATITATASAEGYSNATASYKVYVTRNTTDISMTTTDMALFVGQTETRAASSETTGATITYSSSNTSIATVSGAGLVTAVSAGTANITATATPANTNSHTTESKTYKVTVSKYTTSINLSEDAMTLELKNGAASALTTTVNVTETSGTITPSITWTSSDETVATVAAGVVTPLKVGTTTITAAYAGDGTYVSSSATCAVTVEDNRTAVNIESFSATTNPIVKTNNTATAVTNNQAGWTEAYTYTSSDETVATIAADGTISALKKGTTTITATLNVSASDQTYKAGSTTSKSFTLTVTNPFHTVTYSINDNTSVTEDFEEGATITFPDDPADINGFTFRGWTASTISGTTDEEPTFVTSATMSTSPITYYAVFAEIVTPETEESITKSITTSTTNIPTSYGSANTFTEYTFEGIKFKVQQMYVNGDKLQWRSGTDGNGAGTIYNTEALSKIQSVVLTYNGDNYKNFTLKVGDSENPTSGTSITPTVSQENTNVYTYDCSTYNKNYFVLQNGQYAGYLASIAITYLNGTPATYSSYCTSVPTLPKPEMTMSDVVMTWGETGKAVSATATVNDEPFEGTITYSCDDDNLAINSSTGAITCNEPGTYTITASIAASGSNRAAETTCTVTVNKKDISLNFANAIVRKVVADETYTQTVTVDPDAYDGTITYAKTSGTNTGATVNASTAEVAFTNTGNVVVTATAPATTYYNGTTASYELRIQTTPTITVSDQTIAYGTTYIIPAITGGDVTITPTNTAIATIVGQVVTGIAVGTTTITVATAESDTYTAGEETFTLTVTTPTGASEKPSADPIVVFYESFDDGDLSGGNDNKWNDISGQSKDPLTDNTSWTFVKGYAADECARFGTSSAKGSAQTPSITLEDGITYTLTFKAGAWNGSSESTTLRLSATNATLKNDAGDAALTSVTITKGSWTTYTATVTGNSNAAKIKFESNATSNSRFFLDEVRITKPVTPITSTTVTTTGGLATYCYQYPLNLSSIEGAKAYKVTEVDLEEGKVMMEQITGNVKGGVPFILRSNNGSDDDFAIALADESETVPASNLLIGTLAPTFVAQTSGDYTNFAYSKSNGCFVKLGAAGNTVPANRAYLPINLNGSNDVKSFAISFEDVDGITETQAINTANDDVIYNMAGQRLSKPQRGVNIINGKKVLIK